MESNLKSSLLAICALLEKYEIPYLVVGGTAVALNGYYRHSVNEKGDLTGKPDIDIWYNPTYQNYFKILKVIEELGYDISSFTAEKSPDPKKSYFKLEFDDFSFDILPRVKANLKFTEVFARKDTVRIDKIPIHFMIYSDLIEDKLAAGRKKDLEDIKQLKRVRGKA